VRRKKQESEKILGLVQPRTVIYSGNCKLLDPGGGSVWEKKAFKKVQ